MHTYIPFTVIWAFLISTHTGATETLAMKSDIINVPFKTCVGTGTNHMSEYAEQRVMVTFNTNSIQIVRPDGRKKSYFSANSFCNQDIRRLNVQCSSQIDTVSPEGASYNYSKKCNVPVPGVPNRHYLHSLDLNLTLNFHTRSDGTRSATGWISCVANEDGYHGLNLSDCK